MVVLERLRPWMIANAVAVAMAMMAASCGMRCYRMRRRERAIAMRCEGDNARLVRGDGVERSPFSAPGHLFFLLRLPLLLSRSTLGSTMSRLVAVEARVRRES